MGRQVRFFLDADDHQALLLKVEQDGYVAVPSVIEDDIIPDGEPPTQFVDHPRVRGYSVYLIPPGVSVAEAMYHEVTSEPGLYQVTGWVSPVIELSPGEVHPTTPAEGRIYFECERDITTYAQGLRGYERLAHYLKKWPRTADKRFYVGPHLHAAWTKGDVELPR